jgi:hypothetical protein
VIMAYRLISEEQKRDHPRSTIIRAIYVFMLINLLNVIVVGFLGLPAISRNNDLTKENEQANNQLGVKEKELEALQKAREFDLSIDTTSSVVSMDQVIKIDEYVQTLDSLENRYSAVDSVKADSIHTLKVVISQQAVTLKSDTASAASRKKALKQINLSNHKLNKFMKIKDKAQPN